MKRLSKSARLLWRTPADGPGIYVLRNLKTGKVYIGMTTRNIPERIWEHCKSRKGTVQEVFRGGGSVEVTCDVMTGKTERQMLAKEEFVGRRILQRYPEDLVNRPHLLGKNPQNNSPNSCENGNRIVSCTNKGNNMKNNQRRIIAVRPDGTWAAFSGVRECARVMGLDNSTVSKCLNGLRPHHEGNLFMDVPPAFGAIINGVYTGPTK